MISTVTSFPWRLQEDFVGLEDVASDRASFIGGIQV